MGMTHPHIGGKPFVPSRPHPQSPLCGGGAGHSCPGTSLNPTTSAATEGFYCIPVTWWVLSSLAGSPSAGFSFGEAPVLWLDLKSLLLKAGAGVGWGPGGAPA